MNRDPLVHRPPRASRRRPAAVSTALTALGALLVGHVAWPEPARPLMERQGTAVGDIEVEPGATQAGGGPSGAVGEMQPAGPGEMTQIPVQNLTVSTEAGTGEPALPERDFVFRVPVTLRGLHPGISRVDVICGVSGRWIGDSDWSVYKSAQGRASITPADGAYQGTVVIAFDVDDPELRTLAQQWRCDLEAWGPGGTWIFGYPNEPPWWGYITTDSVPSRDGTVPPPEEE